LLGVATTLSSVVEVRGIEGAASGVGRLARLAGEGLLRIQTGRVRHYALALLAGAVLILLYFLLRSVLG